MNLRLILLLTFFVNTLHSQKVKVLEYGTNFPIENVTIYNDSKRDVVYSNKNGIADLSDFKEFDIISFNHLSYVEYEILKKELAVVEFVIYLIKKAEQLDEIVLSASKGSEKRSRIAEQVVIAFNNDIKKIAPQTSADLLANLPGVKVQKSQFGGGSPVLRGMEANRVLLVVDGVRMNNAIYRMGHLQNAITVSPNTIDRTEVIFGPSSVIYGSDALGGVIHYYTKTPKTSTTKQLNSSLFSRFGSVNNEITSAVNIEFRNKKWASFTSISHSKFSDLRMGKNRNHGYNNWGKVFEFSNNSNNFYSETPVVNSNSNIQKNTGHDQSDFLQKFTFPISSKTNLLFNIQYSKSSNIDRFDKLAEYSDEQLKYAEWYYGPQKRLLLSSQLKLNPGKKWVEKGTITAAFQNIKESRVQRKFTSLNRSYRNENVDVLSINGDFHVPLANDKNRMLSYGFEATHNKVNSKAYGKTLDVYNNTIVGFSDTFNVQSRYPDGGSTYTSFATYLNYRQDINSKTTLNTGIRYNNTYLTAKWIDDTFITLPSFDISLNNSAVTATIGYAFKPTKNWQFNTVVSSGFRSPNIDDVGKVREKSGNVTVPNIYLKPEYAYNFETGILKYFNNKQFQAGLSVYYTLLDNYISRNDFEIENSSSILYENELGNIVANINNDNAYIFGSTFSFKGKMNNIWFTNGSVTYTKGKTYDTKLPLSSIPPLFGMLEIGFEKERIQASVNWKFNSKKALKDYNLIEGIDNIEQTPLNQNTGLYEGSPAWNTLNVSAKYELNKSLSLFLNLDNIFDIHYKEFASSISTPGRNISVSFFLKL